jgi:hypothetical protein
MMPKRIPPYLARQSRAHPLATVLVTVVLIGAPGYAALEKQANSVQRQSECGDAYADALYAAIAPREAATKRVDDADATVWEATQTILTRHATPGDYITLRIAVTRRNRLWAELVAEQKAHPLPPPPSTFC